MPTAPTFRRFARAVRWRYVLARGVERVGISVLISTAAAVLLLPVLWWYSVAALPLVATLVAGGLAVGVIAACLNWPTQLASVMEADRQLKLADLLGTALVVTDRDGPWAATILSLADARCRHLSANSVIFRRWGGRAWGGVALAVTLTLAAGWLLNQPASLALARDDARQVFSEPAAGSQRAERRTDWAAARPNVLPRSDRSSMASSENTNPDNATPAFENVPDAKAEPKSTAGGSGPGGDAGQGTGRSQTSAKPPTTPDQTAAAISDAGPDRSTTPRATGKPAGGTGTNAPGEGTNSGGIATPSPAPGAPAPSWQPPRDQTPDAPRQWQERLKSQPQLDAYRDLVTAFFDRR